MHLHSLFLCLSCSGAFILAVCSIEAVANAECDAAYGASIVKHRSLCAGVERAVLVARAEEVGDIERQREPVLQHRLV